MSWRKVTTESPEQKITSLSIQRALLVIALVSMALTLLWVCKEQGTTKDYLRIQIQDADTQVTKATLLVKGDGHALLKVYPDLRVTTEYIKDPQHAPILHGSRDQVRGGKTPVPGNTTTGNRGTDPGGGIILNRGFPGK